MRAALLAFTLVGLVSHEVLAQGGYPPRSTVGATGADGPMLGPPVVDIPGVPTPPATPPAASPQRKPKFFRLPPVNKGAANGAESADSKKVFSGRWSKRQSASPMPAPEVSLPGTQTDPAALPSTVETPAKSPQTTRKFGPLEIFPKPKEGDRTGNPLQIRRPVLAW